MSEGKDGWEMGSYIAERSPTSTPTSRDSYFDSPFDKSNVARDVMQYNGVLTQNTMTIQYNMQYYIWKRGKTGQGEHKPLNKKTH